MFWLLKFILFGNLILGFAFALLLFLDWLCGEAFKKWSKKDL